jgi:hypothetical protein
MHTSLTEVDSIRTLLYLEPGCLLKFFEVLNTCLITNQGKDNLQTSSTPSGKF